VVDASNRPDQDGDACTAQTHVANAPSGGAMKNAYGEAAIPIQATWSTSLPFLLQHSKRTGGRDLGGDTRSSG
jgi:hypothetical protein